MPLFLARTFFRPKGLKLNRPSVNQTLECSSDSSTFLLITSRDVLVSHFYVIQCFSRVAGNNSLTHTDDDDDDDVLTRAGLNICMSGSATSCEECLLLHHSCAWCAQEVRGPFLPFIAMATVSHIKTSALLRFNSFGGVSATCLNSSFALQDFGKGRTLTSRCDFHQNLQRRGCEAEYIEYPTSGISIRRNMPLSSTGSSVNRYEMTQIMPQDLSLKLRPGERSRRSKSPGRTWKKC